MVDQLNFKWPGQEGSGCSQYGQVVEVIIQSVDAYTVYVLATKCIVFCISQLTSYVCKNYVHNYKFNV